MDTSVVETCVAAMNAGFSLGVACGVGVGVVLVWAYNRWANR